MVEEILTTVKKRRRMLHLCHSISNDENKTTNWGTTNMCRDHPSEYRRLAVIDNLFEKTERDEGQWSQLVCVCVCIYAYRSVQVMKSIWWQKKRKKERNGCDWWTDCQANRHKGVAKRKRKTATVLLMFVCRKRDVKEKKHQRTTLTNDCRGETLVIDFLSPLLIEKIFDNFKVSCLIVRSIVGWREKPQLRRRRRQRQRRRRRRKRKRKWREKYAVSDVVDNVMMLPSRPSSCLLLSLRFDERERARVSRTVIRLLAFFRSVCFFVMQKKEQTTSTPSRYRFFLSNRAIILLSLSASFLSRLAIREKKIRQTILRIVKLDKPSSFVSCTCCGDRAEKKKFCWTTTEVFIWKRRSRWKMKKKPDEFIRSSFFRFQWSRQIHYQSCHGIIHWLQIRPSPAPQHTHTSHLSNIDEKRKERFHLIISTDVSRPNIEIQWKEKKNDRRLIFRVEMRVDLSICFWRIGIRRQIWSMMREKPSLILCSSSSDISLTFDPDRKQKRWAKAMGDRRIKKHIEKRQIFFLWMTAKLRQQIESMRFSFSSFIKKIAVEMSINSYITFSSSWSTLLRLERSFSDLVRIRF